MVNDPMVKVELIVELEVLKLLKSTGVVETGTPLLQFVATDQLPEPIHRSPVDINVG